MSNAKIRKITADEYDRWRANSQKNYAAEKQKEGLSEEDAKKEASDSFARHLPQGPDTENHFIYSVVLNDQVLGTIWWGIKNQGARKAAWIYDIELLPEHRGKGHGKKTMELAQADVKSKGIDRLGLHVFGHNKVAQQLYLSSGFEVTNLVMYKDL